MKKILITGANGFIGSFLVEEALSRGYEVYAGIRSTSNRKYLSDPRIKFFTLDFSSVEKLKRQFQEFKKEHGKFNFVIHNAGITKARKKEDFISVNYTYTKNLVTALRESECLAEKFIYISSLAAMGPGIGTAPILQSKIPAPVTSYGKSKLDTEQFLLSLKDFPFLIIRPSAVYGPRDHEFYVLFKVINRGIEPYLSRKDQLLSFIYVSDLAVAIFTAMESTYHSRAYFISDGFDYTVEKFIRLAKNYLQKKTISVVIPSLAAKPIAYFLETTAGLLGTVATFNRERLKEYEAENWLCDIEPLKNDLNFSAQYNLETGLKETIQWYKTNGWL